MLNPETLCRLWCCPWCWNGRRHRQHFFLIQTRLLFLSLSDSLLSELILSSIVAVVLERETIHSSSGMVTTSIRVSWIKGARCRRWTVSCKICTLKKILFAKQHNFYHLRAKPRVVAPIYLTAFRLLSKTHFLFDLTASEKSNCFSDL